LEWENVRLKKVVVDLVLDKAMLQEALSVRTVPMITWAVLAVYSVPKIENCER